MLYKPDVIEPPLSFYVNKLRNKEPFTFARLGDGEWLTILCNSRFSSLINIPKSRQKNSNGCSFTPELAEQMKQVIRQQHPYQYALLRITRRKQGDKIIKWLEANQIDMDWYNGDLFLDVSLKGELFPLVKEIRERRVLYVGNQRLKDLNMRRAGFFPYVAYVGPPILLPQNSILNKDNLLSRVFYLIERYRIDFIGWSAGLAAKVFINETYQKFPEITQIDFGSMFDGYFRPLPHIQEFDRYREGRGSRSYIRKGNYNWEELWKLNTGKINANSV